MSSREACGLQRAQFSSSSVPFTAHHGFSTGTQWGRLSGRGQGMWNSLNHSLWLLLHLSGVGFHVTEGPIFKAQHLLQHKRVVGYPCLLPHHLGLFMLQKNTGGDQGSCCSRKTGRDQGSCWSLPVTGGLELMSCSPHGWQKCCCHPEWGMLLMQSRVPVPAQPRSGWWLWCPQPALWLLGNNQLWLKLRG